MKRILACLLVVVMLLAVFAACAEEDKTTQTQGGTDSGSSNSDTDKDDDDNQSNVNNQEESDTQTEKPSWNIADIPESSEDLELKLNEDGKSYTVLGIGTCKEKEIVIGKYEKLPVTAIQSEAFKDCAEITKVTISDCVSSVGSNSFSGCAALAEISIGDSVIGIARDAFDGTAYYNNAKNWDGEVFYAGKHLISAKDTLVGEYKVKDKTVSVANMAFAGCTSLTSVTVVNSVKCIGSRAFEGCNELASISLPLVGDSATDPKKPSMAYMFGVKTDEDGNVEMLPEKLRTVVITGGESIPTKAFEHFDQITKITLPKTLLSIGSEAFSYCTALAEISVNKDNKTFHSKNNCIIKTSSKVFVVGCKKSVIPTDGSVKSIQNGAFSNCVGLTSVSIPDSITTVEDYAFKGCTALESVNIGKGVKALGGRSFYGCTAIAKITVTKDNATYTAKGNCVIATKSKTLVLGCKASAIPTDGSVTSIGDGAFEGCQTLTAITIPDKIEKIGANAFKDCAGLVSVTLGKGVASIGELAFDGCKALEKVYISNLTKWCGIDFDVRESNPLYFAHNLYLNSDLVTELVIPKEIVTLAPNAFVGCTSIEKITISNGVSDIGYRAFSGCTKITEISIPNSIRSIGDQAFSDCTALKKITIDDSKIIIGSAAFYNTEYYNTEKNWENSILYIGNHLIDVKVTVSGECVIKEGTKTIAQYAFSKCAGITSITVPNTVISIGDYAFYDCTGLVTIQFSGTAKEWKAISKEYGWDTHMGEYTVKCSDADIPKA